MIPVGGLSPTTHLYKNETPSQGNKMAFINEKTNKTIHAPLNGTLIHSTFRTQDLIPAYLEALKDTAEYEQLMVNNGIPSYALEDKDAEWWDEDGNYLLEELVDILEQYAPSGYYFGSHPNDGCDIGFWLRED